MRHFKRTAIRSFLLTGLHLTLVLMFIACGSSDKTSGGAKADSPSETARKLLTNFQDRNASAQELMSMISAKNREMLSIGGARDGDLYSYRTFKREASKWISMQGGIASLDLINEKIEGDFAAVDYAVRWGNGRSDSETMSFVKEDGMWKVNRFLLEGHEDWLKDNY